MRTKPKIEDIQNVIGVMLPIANKIIVVTIKDIEDKIVGIANLATACLKGSTGMYLIICTAFSSRETPQEALELMTLENKSINAILIPLMSSGKYTKKILKPEYIMLFKEEITTTVKKGCMMSNAV